MSNLPQEDGDEVRAYFDYRGYVSFGGGVANANGYLWLGDDNDQCMTHTTSLKSLREIRAMCDTLIQAREAKYARDKKRRRARGRAK